jgi:hypothetical protein
MTPSPLARYSALLQQLVAYGYSHLNAGEAIQRVYPALWQEAEAERRRQVFSGKG